MSILTIQACTEQLPQLLDFIHGQLRGLDCPDKIVLQIDLAVEEIFVNIATYAYPQKRGQVCIRCKIGEDDRSITIVITDQGIPFNPLQHPNLDTTLPVTERSIGGLGIFLTKQMMDNVDYQWCNNENRISLYKHF
ncbi:MAG: ATP-binding protein [Megasphaera sp.]|nr:ATP-binding protein [Megasphaera sp.]MCH4187627.1 ATP-binding protein [Megasphaera sp.]MCH4217177.1 ATP-binding protein [Megasphaera sp.]